MSDNQAAEANSRVKDAPRSFTGDQIVKNDTPADQAGTTSRTRATTSSTPSQAAAANSTHVPRANPTKARLTIVRASSPWSSADRQHSSPTADTADARVADLAGPAPRTPADDHLVVEHVGGGEMKLRCR